MRSEVLSADETTNRLRRSVADTARLPPALTVEAAVEAAMCVLVQRLTAGQAHELLDALPSGVRPMFRACVLHRDARPTARVDRAEVLHAIADHLGVTPAHAELIAAAVYDAVRRELPIVTAARVAHQLPRALQELWLAGPLVAPDLDTTRPAYRARGDVLDDVAAHAPLPPRVSAEAALVAVACSFTRRLSGGEARAVLLGLPDPLRPMLEPCMLHRAEPAEVFDREALLDDVARHLGIDRADAEPVALAVLGALKNVLPLETLADVAAQLPADLRDLWSAA